ncbi:MAG: ribonuclease HI [Oscillospiraceae bacterium]|jgi:ribonuclease HI|nr:ribonuclease HI [Oscillospiraceae bacterium]
MKEVSLYCDGSCSGNPGPGGWGAILRFGAREKELAGGAAATTNNRMELTALIEGLRALKEPCRVRVVTDSRYVADGVTKGWAAGWKRNGWIKGDKKPALNADLWDALLTELARHEVALQWVRGHAGHPENERCDALAVAQTRSFSKEKESNDARDQ